MNLIVAVDENWGIGKDNQLLCRISADLKRFRAITTGHVLVLGRKTLESFPNGKPLPNRTHMVLTANKAYPAEGVTLCHSLEELLRALAAYREEEIFVIGGGSVYRQLLPKCKKAYITKIYDTFPADTFFPDLDKDAAWTLTQKGEVQEENGVKFSFDIYEQKG